MRKFFAVIVVGMFAFGSTGAFAAGHAAAQPTKDAKVLSAEECKDAKNKDHKDCVAKKADNKDKK